MNRPLVLALAALAACSSGRSPASEEDAPGAGSAASAQAATERPEPGQQPAQAGEPLTFTPPADWVVRTPTSAMRFAEYTLPGAGGAGDAELVVYYFGRDQGGSLEANLARWAGQFEQPDGGDSSERLVRSERRVLGMPVHEVALSGTYVAETMPGSGERVNHPGWSMRAAIIESDHGPYYLKLTGPEATVEARAAELRALVTEVR